MASSHKKDSNKDEAGKDRAHRFDSDEAREAGRKGGAHGHGGNKSHDHDTEEGSSPYTLEGFPTEEAKSDSQSHKNEGSGAPFGSHSRGGSSEQHAKAGSQSHKNEGGGSHAGSHSRGGSSEQHAKAGSQSHKNEGGGSHAGSRSRGGSSEQHAKAGSQSHKKK